MWKVHVVDLGKLFLFKICRVVKFLFQILTRCGKVESKCDKTKKGWFKIWQDEKSWIKVWQDEKKLIQNLTKQKNLIQNHAFYKIFFFPNHAF